MSYKEPVEKKDDCLYQIDQLIKRIQILENNSNIFHEVVTKIQQEIDQVVENGEKTGKFYKIPSVQLNNIKVLLSNIQKFHDIKNNIRK